MWCIALQLGCLTTPQLPRSNLTILVRLRCVALNGMLNCYQIPILIFVKQLKEIIYYSSFFISFSHFTILTHINLSIYQTINTQTNSLYLTSGPNRLVVIFLWALYLKWLISHYFGSCVMKGRRLNNGKQIAFVANSNYLIYNVE